MLILMFCSNVLIDFQLRNDPNITTDELLRIKQEEVCPLNLIIWLETNLFVILRSNYRSVECKNSCILCRNSCAVSQVNRSVVLLRVVMISHNTEETMNELYVSDKSLISHSLYQKNKSFSQNIYKFFHFYLI